MKRFYIFPTLVLFALPVATLAEPQARPKTNTVDPWAVTAAGIGLWRLGL